MIAKMIQAIISLLLLSTLSWGAEVGDTISNSAYVEYSIDDQDKNLTTNEANATVVQTDATIELLNLTPNSGDLTTIEPTQYLDSNGVWHYMPDGIPAYGSVLQPPASVETQLTTIYAQSDLVIIKVTDLDRDTNSSSLQTIEINITDPATGDIETLTLLETNTSSGVFIGYTQVVPPVSPHGDGVVAVNVGDQIVVSYVDNGTIKEVVAKAEIIAIKFRLKVTKIQSKDKASIGEFVKYSITVENIGTIPLRNILIEDKQPYGVKYQKWSFQIQGQKIEPMLSPDGKILSIMYAKLNPGESVTMSFVALITAGVIDHKATNTAWASAPYGGVSNTATVTLEVIEELYRSRGFIVGQVYDADVPKDTNHTADTNDSEPNGKYGIEGIRLYMEDGRFVETDKNGKYHFQDVINGTHVVQIDEQSLGGKYRLALCRDNTKKAGSKRSQFVDIYHASLARADFCLENILRTMARGRLDISVRKNSKTKVRVHVTIGSDENMGDPEIFLALSEGLEYVDGSISGKLEPIDKKGILSIKMREQRSLSLNLNLLPSTNPDKEIRGLLYYDTDNAQNERSDIRQIVFTTKPLTGDVNITHSSTQDPMEIADDNSSDVDIGSLPESKDESNWTKPTHQAKMPKYTPYMVDEFGKKPQIVWPPKDWIPDLPSIRIAVLYPDNGRVKIYLNGKEINSATYESVFTASKTKMRIIHYKGVKVPELASTITATVFDKKGKVIAKLSRKVFVESRAPARVEFLPKYSWLVADGINEPIIAVRFIGPSGHYIRSMMVGAYSTDSNHAPSMMANGKGRFTIDSEGIAYIRLQPTVIGGETKLYFRTYSGREVAITANLESAPRDWILVGYAKGTIGYNTLHGHMDSLAYAGAKDGWYKDGRLAFYAKGTIKGEWLLTLAYDTGREDGDRELFDKIDPNAYYTLYNDATTQQNDVPSTKKLYVKIEKGTYYAMYGDYKTELDETDLAGYSRSMTGLKSEYKGKNIHTIAFVAETQNLFYRDEMRGDGTPGYYHLTQKDILQGTETITLEVRDRYRNEIILDSRELYRYEDYDIDYDDGTIYFKEPIYSTDGVFNPQFIVATYEKDGDEQGNYTYGGRVSYTSDDGNRTIGATAISEEGGRGANRLYAIDGSVQMGENIELKAEYARSVNTQDGDRVTGDAAKATLKYEDTNKTIQAYYRKQDKSFGLGQLSDTLAATRKIGVDAEITLSDNWKSSSTIYQNREYDDNLSTKDQNVLQSTADYSTDRWENSIGYRYAKATDSNGTHQIIGKIERKFESRDISVWLSHDQTLGSGDNKEFPSKTATGVKYDIDDNRSTELSVERSSTDGDSVWKARVGYSQTIDTNSSADISLESDSGNENTGRLTQIGVTYKRKIWQDADLNLGSGYKSNKDGYKLFNTMGITRAIVFSDKWKMDIGYEKGLEYSTNGGSDSDYDSANLGAGYTGEEYDSDVKLGYKHSSSEEKVNIGAGIYIKKSDAIGLAFTIGYRDSWGGDSDERDMDGKMAFVYRPEMTDWIILDRMDITDSKSKSSTNSVRTQKFINNLHLNWEPHDRWSIGFQYGLKHVIDHIDDKEYTSWTDLVGIDTRYDISRRWSLGIQGSVLHSYTGNNLDYGAGVFVDTVPMKNTVFTVGYNIKGFDDDDFSLQNYHYEGPYIQLKIKFDQTTVKDIAKSEVLK